MKSFLIDAFIAESFKYTDNATAGEVVKAICKYEFDGVVPEMSASAAALFWLVLARIHTFLEIDLEAAKNG